eukprot:Em0009g1155a
MGIHDALQRLHRGKSSAATEVACFAAVGDCSPACLRSSSMAVEIGGAMSKILDYALSSADSIVLFPGDKALKLCTLPRRPIGASDGAAVIVIDGTWSQAKSIFNQSRALGSVRQVQLTGVGGSEYSIRTQPTRGSLSTLESVAHILAWLETDPAIVEGLVRPLRAMCRHQIDHGAVHHHSRDDPEHVSRQEYKLKQETYTQEQEALQEDHTSAHVYK